MKGKSITHLSNGTTVTNIDATTNGVLSAQGYTIHYIEDFPGHASIIHWHRPNGIMAVEIPF